MTLEWCYMDGCSSLLDVVHLAGKNRSFENTLVLQTLLDRLFVIGNHSIFWFFL